MSDFPPERLASHGILAVDPDTFVCSLFDCGAEPVLGAIHRHRTSLKRPPKSPVEYLETLRSSGLVKTTERLREPVARI